MKEEWRPVVDFEGYYEVSSLGVVRSIDRYIITTGGRRFVKGKLLKPRLDRYGYLRVNLVKQGYRKTYTVHRLVALAFLPNPNKLTQINHIDENKLNNRVDNLEWCTVKYNNNYGTRTERSAKSHSKPVNQYDKQGNLLHIYSSLKKAGKTFPNSNADNNIRDCCKGRTKTAYGYIWRYAD